MTSSAEPLVLGPLGKADVGNAARFAARLFADVAPEDQLRSVLRQGADPDASLALRRGGEIVGVYLVRKPNIHFPLVDVPEPSYPGLKGLRLDVLALSPELRGRGYGRLMREAVRTAARENGFDYVWGAAGHKLANREQWLKVRALDRDLDGAFVSLDPLNAAARSAFASKASEEARAAWERDVAAPAPAVSGRTVLQRLADGNGRTWTVSATGVRAGDAVPAKDMPPAPPAERPAPRNAKALRAALSGAGAPEPVAAGADRGTSRAMPCASLEDMKRLDEAGFVFANVDGRLGWAHQKDDGQWVCVLAKPMPKNGPPQPSLFALMTKEPNKRARYRWIGVDEVLAEAGLSEAPRMAP